MDDLRKAAESDDKWFQFPDSQTTSHLTNPGSTSKLVGTFIQQTTFPE